MSNPEDILDSAIAEAEASMVEESAAPAEEDASLDSEEARAQLETDDTLAAIEESAKDSGKDASSSAPDPLAAGLAVKISDDGLKAELTLPSLHGASRPDVDAIIDELKTEHKIAAPDVGAVEYAIEQALASESRPVTATIAEGQAPVKGEDGAIEWLGDFFESQAIRMPDGSVDHYHHTKVSVYEGQPLVQIHPPTSGHSGRTVRGKPIKPASGTPVELEFDETIKREERNPNILCAAHSGMVECYRGKVTVSNVQIVEAVDFSTGSIDFEGAVQVRNGVAPKFSVVGSGAVIIGGPVENARVESRKSVTIEKGVLGKGDAVVICPGDMSIGFAREATIQCGGRLVARRELLWCEGEVHGDMLVDTGRIVGGHWRCGGRVVADEIGSREEVTTILTLGEAPEQNRALKVLTRDRKKYHEQIAEFRRKYGPLLSGRIGQIDPKEREQLEQRLELYQRQASRSRKREYILRKRLNIQRRASFVWVKTKIFGGTRLRMNGGQFVHEFTEEQPGPVCVRFDADTRTTVVEHIGLEDCTARMK